MICPFGCRGGSQETRILLVELMTALMSAGAEGTVLKIKTFQ
jgi:DhnA family fructose-bisphosphate aldolase class Ia